MSKKKSQQKELVNQNPFEAIGSVATGISEATTDLAKDGFSDFWKQLLGGGGGEKSAHHETPQHGDLSEGQELVLNKKDKKEDSHHREIEPGIDYHREIVHAEQRVSRAQTNEIESKIQEIIFELKRLTSSSDVLQAEFREVTTDTRIVNPGKYHLSFFEWMLVVVQQARMRVEDSGAWLATMKSKKGKHGYWDMFQKHGTSFGMSNERGVATQTG